jgi:hypothetical protein
VLFTQVANLPPVSLIPVAPAGIIDSGGKFAAGIVDTGGKICHRYQ